MKTALYQGRRVQVVGESLLMAFYGGKWYPTGDKCPLICEIGDNPISAFDVEAAELSDYQDSEMSTLLGMPLVANPDAFPHLENTTGKILEVHPPEWKRITTIKGRA